ncbi:MAG: hypothetical protein GWO24_19240 [Akkermansiaceae bacterium]|nr:hypothetical protein [Akkermansiaceae bacterium]
MESGVRYRRDPAGQEPWRTIPEILERKGGDCEDLACWYAAELRMRGIRAHAVPQTRDGNMWHIVVRLPDGRIVDPSKALGME